MRGLALAISAALALAIAPVEPTPKIQGPTSQRPVQQLAVTCFKTGEQVSGLNKICFYNCVGSGTAITIKSYQLCPLTIDG